MPFLQTRSPNLRGRIFYLLICLCLTTVSGVHADNLDTIRNTGVLRHLGIPYANFVRESADGGVDGLDVDMMQLFAKHLGVKYQFVKSSWSDVFSDLTGKRCVLVNGAFEISAEPGRTDRGDIIANGLTIFPYRQEIVDYSIPTFPTGVWLAARADSELKPISPSGSIDQDIATTKTRLQGKTVLAIKGTCLDPALYDLDTTGARILFFTQNENLNEIAPAVLSGTAETTLLDIPDALVAIQKWPGDLKIIGPISKSQVMGVAVAKDSPKLLQEFNRFFEKIWNDGTYRALVKKYYPSIFIYLGDFFDRK